MPRVALSRYGKSKSIITIVVCFFLVLDCTALGINLLITKQVDADALAINIAGRQRMLSQRMTKVLLLMSDEQTDSADYKKELAYVYRLFRSTLNVFEAGGLAVDGQGNNKAFSGLTDAVALAYVSETQHLIDELGFYVEKVLENPQDEAAFKAALAMSKRNNLTILDLMNALTFRIEQMTAEKTMNLRWIQTFAFVLALLNFAIIIRLYNKRTSESEMLMQSFMHLVNNAAACLIVLDAKGRVQFANEMGLEVFGYPEDVLFTLASSDLFRTEHGVTYAITASGEAIEIELIERKFVLNGNDFFIVTVNDISHHAEEQARLSYLANHDSLTGLCNRRVLLDRLNSEVAHAELSETKVGLFFIDLDKFKPVNDLLGHAVGDVLLKTFANRLKNAVRESDIVARYGGDEFVVLMSSVSDEAAFQRCYQTIEEIFIEPFVWEGNNVFLSCSIGMSIYPTDSHNAQGLLSLADQRMYASKRERSTAV
jgi:diguanylate cyclase (GGDEF)-like protein